MWDVEDRSFSQDGHGKSKISVAPTNFEINIEVVRS